MGLTSCCTLGADDFLPPHEQWADHPARRDYEVLRDLGSGAFSQVVLARHKDTQELVALKVCFLDGPDMDAEHLQIALREADWLNMLDHPGIVTCRDVIRNQKQMVLVMEWLRGGQVIDRLHELPQYSEQVAADIFKQVAEAVAYMHEYSVLHRDIKPENVMWVEPPSPSGITPPTGLTVAQLQQRQEQAKKAGGKRPSGLPRVKLIDLGMACLYTPDQPVRGALGSAGFVAPEVVRDEPHTPAMDVFSMGVLLFVMMVGRKPFNIKQTENLQYAFLRLADAPGFQDPRWLELSPDAKDLIMGMLAYDPGRRLTAQQVLKHEWVTTCGGALPRQLSQDVVFGAATVASVRRLRHLCGGVVSLQRATEAAAAAGKAGSTGGGWATASTSAGGGGTSSSAARDAFLRQQRLAQRRNVSMRGEGAMNKLARRLASKSYARMHDAGGSVHPSVDISVHFSAVGAGSCEPSTASRTMSRSTSLWRVATSGSLSASVAGGGSTNGRWKKGRAVLPAGGMRRAATSVLLSEMDRSKSTRPSGADRGRNPSSRGSRGNGGGGSVPAHAASSAGLAPSVKSAGADPGAALTAGSASEASTSSTATAASKASGGAGPDFPVAAGESTAGAGSGTGAGLTRRPSSLQLLAAAAKTYLQSGEGSRHSLRASGSSANLQAAALAAAGSGAVPSTGATASSAAAAAAAAGGEDAEQQPSAPAAGQPLPAGKQQSSGGVLSHETLASNPSLPASTPADCSFSSQGGSAHVDNADPLGRPLRKVVRRSLDNPLVPGASAGPSTGLSWVEVQASLKGQSPRPGSSRDATFSRSGTATKVRVLKPLE